MSDSKRLIQDSFSLANGKALLTVEYAEPLGAEELADLEDWLALVVRKLRRSVKGAPVAERPRQPQEDVVVAAAKLTRHGSRYDHDELRRKAARYIADYGTSTTYRLEQYVVNSPSSPTWLVVLRDHPWFEQHADGWRLTTEGLAAMNGQELPAPLP